MEKLLDNDTEGVVEAISNATGGSFIDKVHSSTLMGWVDKYDSQGRCVTCDPNYKDCDIIVNEQKYHITKQGWFVYIWKPEVKRADYTTLWGVEATGRWNDAMLAIIDLAPDYVKEYRKNQEKQKTENKNG